MLRVHAKRKTNEIAWRNRAGLSSYFYAARGANTEILDSFVIRVYSRCDFSNISRLYFRRLKNLSTEICRIE